MIGLLVLVIIAGLLVYLVQVLPLPPPFKTVALVVVILIAIIWLLDGTGTFSGGGLRIR